MKIAPRNQQRQEEETYAGLDYKQNRIDFKEVETNDQLDLIKYTSQVQSRIRTDISSDFILAKLETKDKEAIIEMTSNAYMAKGIILMAKDKMKQKGKPAWNTKLNKWTQIPYTKQEYKKMDKIAQNIFDIYMTRIYMTVLLNRNVPKNYLIRILSGTQEEDTEKLEQEEDHKIGNKIRKLMKNEDTKKEKE